MEQIQLTKGLVAITDGENFEVKECLTELMRYALEMKKRHYTVQESADMRGCGRDNIKRALYRAKGRV